MITVTTVDVTDGNGLFKVELINGKGQTILLYKNTYGATTWSSYCFRLYYFSTSKLFLFNILISSSADIETAPTSGTTMYFVKDSKKTYWSNNEKHYNNNVYNVLKVENDKIEELEISKKDMPTEEKILDGLHIS